MKNKIIKILVALAFTLTLTNTVVAAVNDLKTTTTEDDLAGDYIVSSSRNITKEFTVETNATIDLQNNTLTYKDNDTLFTITGTLTVKNGTIAVYSGKTGSLFGTTYPGKLILENVNLSSSGYLPTYYECKTGIYNFDPTNHLHSSASGLGVYSNSGKTVYTVGHKVTFDPNNEEDTFEEYVVDGKTVDKPSSDPSKDGHTFNYWTLNSTEYDFTSSVSGNLSLVANYTADQSQNNNNQSQNQNNQNQNQNDQRQNQDNQQQSQNNQQQNQNNNIQNQNEQYHNKENSYNEPVTRYITVNTSVVCSNRK